MCACCTLLIWRIVTGLRVLLPDLCETTLGDQLCPHVCMARLMYLCAITAGRSLAVGHEPSSPTATASGVVLPIRATVEACDTWRLSMEIQHVIWR